MRKLPFLTAAALLFVTAVPVKAGYTPASVHGSVFWRQTVKHTMPAAIMEIE